MSPIGTPANCYRCGKEFARYDRERICPTCRKPKERARPSRGAALSPREKQVVELVARGKLNKEIGADLHLTEGTIKEYLNRIFRKLGVTNRTELAVWRVSQP